ncbi:MAG: hypothetical protein JW714_00170 [Candidatus Omnitrophica bacterium]|nr:hypothetical protein [Candidatus Omnitrophota bacterium]
MAKQKIDIQKEVTKIWREAKENLKTLGQRAFKIAQKGEKEVVRASKIGKLQLDIVSLNLKKENIYRQIGKKAYEIYAKKAEITSDQLAASFNQLDKTNHQIKSKKAQIAKQKKG